MKKLLSILMIVTMLALAMTGCGGDKTPTNNNQQMENNINQVTDENNNRYDAYSDVGTQTNEITESKILEDIQLSDQRSGRVWKYDIGSDGSKITMSAGYTVDTDYVYDITFSVKINKSNNAYEEFKNELTNYEIQLKTLNDDEITVSLRETEESIEFFALFDGLEYANREQRIKMAEKVISITANNTDISFRFTEIDSELKEKGFVYGT